MTHNYPIKQKNQNEHPKFSDIDYIATPVELPVGVVIDDLSTDVEIEMSRTVYDMRREFHRTVRKFKNHFAEKEPRASIYKFGYTYPTGIHFFKRRAMG